MNNVFYIPSTPKTPSVFFDLEEGIFEYVGRVICEDTIEFHRPIVHKLEEFNEKYPDKPLKVTFALEWLNTSSGKCVLDMFKKMEAHHKNSHSNVTVYWYYEEDDEDMLETGEDYETVVRLPFVMLGFKEYDEVRPIFIKESEKSPMVYFDDEKYIFEIIGISKIERTIEFYQPLIFLIESIVWNNKEKQYTIKFQIESCNRESISYFRRFLSFFNECVDVTARWYYKPGNKEMYSLGQSLRSELKYDLELVQIAD